MQRARNSSVLEMKAGVPKLIYTEESCEYHMVLHNSNGQSNLKSESNSP